MILVNRCNQYDDTIYLPIFNMFLIIYYPFKFLLVKNKKIHPRVNLTIKLQNLRIIANNYDYSVSYVFSKLKICYE